MERVALAAAPGVAVGLGREGFGSPCLFRAAHVTSTELRGGVRRGRCGALEGEGWGGGKGMSVPNTRVEASGAEELDRAGLAFQPVSSALRSLPFW